MRLLVCKTSLLLSVVVIGIVFTGCPTGPIIVTPPTITTQPQSTSVTVGQAASFTVVATNATNYQWQTDGSDISGATAATYSIAAAQASDAGSYVCVVSNSGGSVSSNAAVLTVNPTPVAPTITTQPTSQVIAPNTPFSLSVAATGTTPLAYQWQRDGSNISGATLDSYSVAVAQYTDTGSYACVVSNSAGSATSDSATLTVLAIKVVAKNGDDITAENLTTQPSSGLRNVGIGNDVYLQADPSDPTATYAWAVTGKPSGSNPSLSAVAGDNTVFNPDKEGTYHVQLTETPASAGTAAVTTSVEITAGTWVGVGIIAKDGSTLSDSQCAYCHVAGGPAPDKITPWMGTEHATMFARGIDGEVSSHYGASCMSCHTVGYDTNALAVNNGADDVATALNWIFPTTLQEGNWDALVTGYPSLARLCNIQCENCHGPASQHPQNAFSSDIKMDKSLDAGVCAQCHYGHHPQYDQWKLSGHADASAEAFIHPAGNTACARCHTGGGYIDFINGVPTAQQNTNFQIITCAVCHDPHDASNPYQLRTTSVTLPGETTPRTNDGPSATCMNCHNARVAPSQFMTSQPHHSTAAEMLKGINGITFGVHLGSSTHTLIAECVDCHMGPSPTSGEGVNKVGGHTMMMEVTNPNDPDYGFQNIANTCNSTSCHKGALAVTNINRTAFADYDGNGEVQGVQDEVKGLLSEVLQALTSTTGIVHLSGYPEWDFSNVPSNLQTVAHQAAWNYDFVNNDGSYGIHNTEYAVGLLQLTYKQLMGHDIPNAYLRYK